MLAATIKNLNCLKQSAVFRSYCNKVRKNKLTAVKQSIQSSPKLYGQPAPDTHPHLLKLGEVTPGILQSEFQNRRQRLIESVLQDSQKRYPNLKCHLIVIPSASKQYMSDKIPYVFRQNTDFLYLSGCLEPDTCLVLSTTGTPSQHYSILFVREKDSHSELWDGPRTGTGDAIGFFGVDQALSMSELPNYIEGFVKSNPQPMLWYDYMTPTQKQVHSVMLDVLNEKFNNMWDSPSMFIHRQRAIKSPAEIDLMKKTCDIASNSIAQTIRFSKPGMTEHQLFAHVDYQCRMKGASYLAYPPVVAGGNRANIIHYIDNNQVVDDGDLVLMDAGCEYHGYTSDITRTWPINGKFSPQQTALYEAVLNVQLQIIKFCTNFPTLDRLFESMCLLLGKELQEIGLISKNTASNEDSLIKAAYQFCPHHVSHYLGMDVHDTSSVPRSINIQPGMVVTVEPVENVLKQILSPRNLTQFYVSETDIYTYTVCPRISEQRGIYINSTHKVPKEFQGLGVRIEDDVLITESGPVVLSKNCPKTLPEIEKLANENQ